MPGGTVTVTSLRPETWPYHFDRCSVAMARSRRPPRRRGRGARASSIDSADQRRRRRAARPTTGIGGRARRLRKIASPITSSMSLGRDPRPGAAAGDAAQRLVHRGGEEDDARVHDRHEAAALRERRQRQHRERRQQHLDEREQRDRREQEQVGAQERRCCRRTASAAAAAASPGSQVTREQEAAPASPACRRCTRRASAASTDRSAARWRGDRWRSGRRRRRCDEEDEDALLVEELAERLGASAPGTRPAGSWPRRRSARRGRGTAAHANSSRARNLRSRRRSIRPARAITHQRGRAARAARRSGGSPDRESALSRLALPTARANTSSSVGTLARRCRTCTPCCAASWNSELRAPRPSGTNTRMMSSSVSWHSSPAARSTLDEAVGVALDAQLEHAAAVPLQRRDRARGRHRALVHARRRGRRCIRRPAAGATTGSG